MDRKTTDHTYNPIDPLPSQIINFPNADVSTGKSPVSRESNNAPFRRQEIQYSAKQTISPDDDEIVRKQASVLDNLNKLERLIKGSQIRRQQDAKNETLESEQLTLNQSYKLLQPSVQKYQNNFPESSTYHDSTKRTENVMNTRANVQGENEVMFNQCRQKLSPAEIQELENIIRTQRIESIETRRAVPGQNEVLFNQWKQKLGPAEIQELENIIKTQRIDTVKTTVKSPNRGHQQTTPKTTQHTYNTSRNLDEPVVPIAQQKKSLSCKPQEDKQSFTTVKSTTMESNQDGGEVIWAKLQITPAKRANEHQYVVSEKTESRQKLTPGEIERMELILNAHGIDKRQIEKSCDRHVPPPTNQDVSVLQSRKIIETSNKPVGTNFQDFRTVTQEKRDTQIKPDNSTQRIIDFIQSARSREAKTNQPEPVRPINRGEVPALKKVLTQVEKQILITTKEIEYVSDGSQYVAPPQQKVSRVPRLTNVPVCPMNDVNKETLSVRKITKTIKPVRTDKIICKEDCDEYCKYIKEIEQDSSELRNHLKALKLVNASPKPRVKKHSQHDLERINSSIDDFIKKLNQDDVETWLPRRLDYSRSLNDLSCMGYSENSNRRCYASGRISRPYEQTQSNVASRRNVESLSRSVLDLTKVGLPRNQTCDEKETPRTVKPQIKVVLHKVNPDKTEIQVRSYGTESPTASLSNEYNFLDRRSSEVFGRKADSSPYVNDGMKTSKPMTVSLQSLNADSKLRKYYQKFDKLQSMECLAENYQVNSDPECRYFSSRPRTRNFTNRKVFQTERDISSASPSSSALSINRIYVRTPYEKEFRDLMQPKKPKSILKKTSEFRPQFESISLMTIPNEECTKVSDTKENDAGGLENKQKIALEKSRSCGSVNTSLRCRNMYIELPVQTKPDRTSQSWKNTTNPTPIATFMTAQKLFPSSNSLSDSQFDSDSSRMSSSTNTPSISGVRKRIVQSSHIRPFQDQRVGQEVSEDEVNLSEVDCLNIQSDDSEFADRGFGYFYQDKSKFGN